MNMCNDCISLRIDLHDIPFEMKTFFLSMRNSF
jgi:hypothetical protein